MIAQMLRYPVPIVLLVLILFAGGPARTPAQAAPLPTSFTYQGQLTEGDLPTDGLFDFRFTLFDVAEGGTAAAPAVTTPAVILDQGVFSVAIDFGPGTAALWQQAAYLQIELRPTGEVDFVTLTPRQPVTPTPQAFFAVAAGQVAWSAINGIPAPFADGEDADTTYSAGTGLSLNGAVFSADFDLVQRRIVGACPVGSAMTSVDADGQVACRPVGSGTITGIDAGPGLDGGGNTGDIDLAVLFAGTGSAETAARSDHHHDGLYQAATDRLRIVTARGTPTENGTELRQALDAITDSSCEKPYLLQLEPGTYDLGPVPLTMKECVDISGAGELITTVTGSGASRSNSGTVIGANNAELRRLTVRNTGAAANAVAVYADDASLKMTHVTAIASGGTVRNYAIYYRGVDVAELSQITAEATGGEDARGIFNDASNTFLSNVRASAGQATVSTALYNESAIPVVQNCDLIANGGGTAYGMFNVGTSSPIVQGGSIFATLGSTNAGIKNAGGSRALVSNVDITVFGGSIHAGVWNTDASAGTLHGLRITVFPAIQSYGIFNEAEGGSYVVDIDTSVITGATHVVRNDDEFTTRIGSSKLEGGSVTGGGTIRCAGVYDEAYTFFAGPTCP